MYPRSICSPVLASAVSGGYPAAVAAALLSAVAYNFFFIEPDRTFTIAQPHEVFGLLIYPDRSADRRQPDSRIGEQASAARDRAIDPIAL